MSRQQSPAHLCDMNWNNQARHTAGTPKSLGGQWKVEERADAGVTLNPSAAPEGLGGMPSAAPDLVDSLFGDAQRHDALLKRGFVPPTFFASGTDPRSRAGIDLWHQQAILAGGNDTKERYPRVPDDWNPLRQTGKAQGGRSAEGNRRTYRRAFTDDGLTMRTFSRNAIKSWAQHAGTTITVPIEAEYQGRKIHVDVLVTSSGAGVWSVEPLGVGGETATRISEALASRLEGRRAQYGGDRAVGNLLERARMRHLREGVETESLEGRSGWVSAVGWSDADGGMVYETSRGGVYGNQVSPSVFDTVKTATSPGAAINRTVKGLPGFETLGRCDSCNRLRTRRSEPHQCPVQRREADPYRVYETQESQKAMARALAQAALAVRGRTSQG